MTVRHCGDDTTTTTTVRVKIGRKEQDREAGPGQVAGTKYLPEGWVWLCAVGRGRWRGVDEEGLGIDAALEVHRVHGRVQYSTVRKEDGQRMTLAKSPISEF